MLIALLARPLAAKGGTMSAPIHAITVLVVDDEQAMRALTRRMLEGVGYQVYEAADGVEALAALLQRGPVDVIVSDLRMPHMDGHELASRLTAQSPRIPMLFMSGYDVYVGPLDLPGPVLAKPFRSEQLTAGVAQLLARQAHSL
jgi:two-component system, cell cycle sensor histidine kinase and response regulator CckA